MFKLIIWILWLIVLLMLCFMQSRRVLLTPQLGLVGCFLPQALLSIYYVDRWDMNFAPKTMIVLMGG